jgi:hypothetical protein
MTMKKRQKSKQPERKPLGDVCAAAFEQSLNRAEAERPALARCLPYGYRAAESPLERAVILSLRNARSCGKPASWTAAEMNRRGVLHRGRQWTARAICRILRPYPDRKGEADTLNLPAILDGLKKFADFVEKSKIDY